MLFDGLGLDEFTELDELPRECEMRCMEPSCCWVGGGRSKVVGGILTDELDVWPTEEVVEILSLLSFGGCSGGN